MLLIILTFWFTSIYALDYCNLCKNAIHTMCQFKEGPADSCINYTEILLTPGEKTYILDIHNDIRNHVASGKESRGALGNQPTAADMSLLEWDEELAKIAQRWADQCISINATMQHDYCRRTEQFDVGQNVVTAITKDGELPDLSILVLNWYKQIMYIIPSDVDYFGGVLRGKNYIGEYTQLVWAKTKFVGCATAAFKETVNDTQYIIRFVCNYGPSGNIIGESVYQRGEPCSKCPHKACDRLRSNLCAGLNKKEKNDIFKIYNDKATTLSNLIDIEDPKFTSKSLNPWTLNKSVLSENDAKIINTTSRTTYNNSITSEREQDFNQFFTNNNSSTNDNIYVSLNEEIFNNTSSTISNCREKGNCLNESFPSYNDITLKYNFTTTREYTNDTVFSHSDLDKNLTKCNGHNYLKDLTLTSRIKLLTDIFFYNIYEEIENFVQENNISIIDLTKNECNRGTKLENGIIILQECKNSSRNFKLRKNTFHVRRRMKVATLDGNDVILPGNRRFKKAVGIWYEGHCRCARFIRSDSIRVNMKHSLYLPTLFACYISIKWYIYSFILFNLKLGSIQSHFKKNNLTKL